MAAQPLTSGTLGGRTMVQHRSQIGAQAPPCRRSLLGGGGGTRRRVAAGSSEPQQPDSQPIPDYSRQQNGQHWQQAAGVPPPPPPSWLQRSDATVLSFARLVVLAPARALLNFLTEMREALALVPQLSYPRPGAVFKQTIAVMLATAFFLLYIAFLEWLFGHIPKAIAWTHAHPGWLRRVLHAGSAAAKKAALGAWQAAAGVGG